MSGSKPAKLDRVFRFTSVSGHGSERKRCKRRREPADNPALLP